MLQVICVREKYTQGKTLSQGSRGKVGSEVIEDGEERTEGMPEALNRPYPNCVPGR
jgi:hypothetical protein